MTTTPASLTLRLLTMAGTAAQLGLERVLTLAGIRMKDLRFGMGLSSFRIAETDRRDRLLLLSALACALLTLLGAAGESLGMERDLKANTSKKRTYSLFRQGCMYYQALPNMPDALLRPLIERFAQLVCAQLVFRETFGLI